MQEAAFAATGLNGWAYQRLPVPPHLFAETVRALPQSGFVGANVTIPHKEAALALATEETDTARQIGAANTLTFADGRIAADNTDAPGLLAALSGPPPRTALVLGAGGSARAAVWALTQAGTDVAIHNRTPERAVGLAQELGARATETLEPADLLVNCTAIGLEDPDTSPVDRIAWPVVVDLVYGDRETALIRAARDAGAVTLDGLEILVRQGALSFSRWTGTPAPLDVMRAAARAA